MNEMVANVPFAMNPLTQALIAETGPGSLPRRGSRRRKIWELNHRDHCPLIGTCLPMADLRRLVRRVGIVEKGVTDYALHVLAVGQSQERTALSVLIQREFEHRFAPVVKRFSRAGENGELLTGWRAAVENGEVAPALWAVLTHPACDESVGKNVYGDIHMLSHQVGGGHRADLRRLAAAEAQCGELRREAQRERERMARRQLETVAELRTCEADLQQARCQAGAQAAACERAMQALAALNAGQAEAAEWRRRAEVAEARWQGLRDECADLRQQLQVAESDREMLRQERDAGEAALVQLVARFAGDACRSGDAGDTSDCATCREPVSRLAGRCLLCIGGRTNLIGHYRGLVEGLGGRFLHHDGGIEDNPRRLEATLASADAVVCQAGCVSHAAYWKLKEYCKRTNKPCLYLKRAGVSSFAQGVGLLVAAEAVP